jgi:hypothetical protein
MVVAVAALAIGASAAPARDAESLLTIVSARGAHHWSCDKSRDATGGYAWRFDRVEMELLEPNGRPAHHAHGSARWQLADGTRLKGTLEHRSEIPARNDLPWIELQADSPRGRASRVAQVMRFAASTGRPPPESCSEQQRGARVRLPWSGEYYFFAQG